jgi:hypothetical protein|nr:MAG TPA: hypothetical protein [Caudoviricetes sp.]
MNNIIKNCIVGGVIYVMCDISFQFGKGYMLGTMTKLDVTGSQALNALSDDKRWIGKFIKKVAETFAD